MAHLVEGHHLALLGVEQAVALFQPGDDALDGRVEILHFHRGGLAPGGQQGGLVDQVGQVGAGETGGQFGDQLRIDVRRQSRLLQVHAEDLHTADLVGAVDQHLAVETPGAQQRRVEDFRAVGGGQQHQAAGGVEAVQLDQQLVEGLLLLVVTAAQRPGATGATEGVQLVDEDDRRGLGARLLEQVAHPRGTNADEQLDELRTGDGEERHPGLTGHRARQQGLAGAGRPDQQHALGQPAAEPAVGLGIAQEVDDFLQLVLGLVHPGDVGEADLDVGLHVDLGLALADLHHAAAHAAADALEQEQPDAEEQRRRNHPAGQVAQEGAFHLAGEMHRVLRQVLGQLRFDAVGDELALAAGQRRLEGALDAAVGDGDGFDAPGLQVFLELAVGNGRHLLLHRQQVLDAHERQNGQQPVAHVELRLFFHTRLPVWLVSGLSALPRRATPIQVNRR